MSLDREILSDACADGPADELLTRKQASAFLATLGVRLKPTTLARLWSTGGNGPPCVHIRSKPFYPREVLRRWAAAQVSGLRTRSGEEPSAAVGGAS